MIGTLIFEAPHVWKIIRELLIGGGGRPDTNGNAVGGFVRQTELKNNATPGTYWYRFFRPDDPMITGGTAQDYYSVFTTATVEHILSNATGADVVVPTGEAAASFGWICLLDLGRGGYLQIEKEGVVKSEIPARIAWRQQDPEGYYIDLDTVIFGEENARIDYIIYNHLGADRTGVCIPILFRIATRAALNLEKQMF